MTTRLFLAHEYNQSMPWGGFHITLIGQRNKMSFNYVRNTSLYNKNRRWTFSSNPDARLEKWKFYTHLGLEPNKRKKRKR